MNGDDDADVLDFGSGITATPTALLFEDAPPFEVWEALGKKLQLHGRAHQWWLGDWLNAGERVYGEGYSQAIDETGFEYGTLADFAYVADHFEVSRRRENVPWAFHRDAASLDAEVADELLAEAAAGRKDDPERWTRVSFRARVANVRKGRPRDANMFTDEEVPPEQHLKLAGGDRCDVASLEDIHWPDDEVDLLLTSPPYGTGMAYSGGGDVETYEQYLELVDQWAKSICRLVNPRHGRIAINVPLDKADNAGKRGRPSYTGRPVYADWVFSLVQAGLSYRSTIIWWDNDAGEGNQRGSVDSPSAPHVVAPCEMIILMFRGSWSRSSERAHDLSHETWLEELGPRGVWQINGTTARDNHPAPWPEELPERLIKLLSFRGDTVADPMCGQGTAGVIAAKLGRRVWLADRSPEYVQLARQALAEARGLDQDEEVA